MDHTREFLAEASSQILAEAAQSRLANAFPLNAAVFQHSLANEPLLSLEMLALAVTRMNPGHVECRQSRNSNGAPFVFADVPSGDPAETIRAIGQSDCWVMLRFAEQLTEYAELLERLLAEIDPIIGRFGPAIKPHAFIFISSPGSLTPFHFDPEFNILFQISGRKRFATYPAEAPWLSNAQQSQFHADGENLLPWQASFAAEATTHQLAPGDALFVPYKAPHWVEVDQEPSVSLSLTWSHQSTHELEAAWQLHAWMQRRGKAVQAPPTFPGRAPVRAAARRLLGKLRVF